VRAKRRGEEKRSEEKERNAKIKELIKPQLNKN
jgi:hypothetical protein